MSRYPTKGRTVAERFWEQIDRGGPDDCWLRRTTGDRVVIDGRAQRPQRWAYELSTGETLDRHTFLRSSCGTYDCCNPAHIERADATVVLLPVSVLADILRSAAAGAPVPLLIQRAKAENRYHRPDPRPSFGRRGVSGGR